jgi:aquaporin Z
VSTSEQTSAPRLRDALHAHWPEYVIEALGLAVFMIAACLFTVLLEHPSSPGHRAIPDAFVRRVLMGVAMGVTAIGLIYSPWGKRSGAHLNPSVTLGFLRLGKVSRADAFFYVVAQFAGGVLGVMVAAGVAGTALADRAVSYAVTVPGSAGVATAFLAELVISFGLFLMVLATSSSTRLAPSTGVLVGLLLVVYIAFEAPYSGMSMNPARTVGSAVFARTWAAAWLYFLAPTLGMLLACEVYVRRRSLGAPLCAKLHHSPDQPCIFACGYRIFHEGDVVMQQGEPADVAYVIERGEVEVRRRDDRGREHVLARLGPRQCVGEMALLLSQPRSATVVAKTDVQLRPFTADDFAEVISRDPQTSLRMLRQLAERLCEVDRRIAS